VKQLKHYCIIVIHKKETAIQAVSFLFTLANYLSAGTRIDVLFSPRFKKLKICSRNLFIAGGWRSTRLPCSTVKAYKSCRFK